MDRRNFVKTLGAGSAWLIGRGLPAQQSGESVGEIYLSPTDAERDVIRKAARVRPHPRQRAWQEREFSAFIHFGMNTFTGRQWGNGREDPRRFNPTALDAGQWAQAAKPAGMKELILTAKHHDGFCLWPSRYTEHSVKNSPWKNGRGDVVGETARACQGHGLKFGVYLSPWDRHEPTYGAPAYNDYFQNQLRELLTNYGEIAEVWFDGAGVGRKHKKMVGLYDWESIFRLVRELQPAAVISICGPDARWCGNEEGKARESEWSVLAGESGTDYQETDRDLGSREKLMAAAAKGRRLKWSPAQTDVSIRPSWFYDAREDEKVRPLSRLLDIYFGAVGGNSQLLLNLPPDPRGLIHEHDVARLHELRGVLDKIFQEDLAVGVLAKSSAEKGGGGTFGADRTVDGNPDTYWTTEDGTETASLEYDLGRPRSFNVARLKEQLQVGQRVEEFFLEIEDRAGWKTAARATTIGYQRLLRFPTVAAQRVRLRVTRSRVAPTLSGFSLYHAPEL